MYNIKSFKQFESTRIETTKDLAENGYMSMDYIKDVFIEMFDYDFEIRFFRNDLNNNSHNKYYFFEFYKNPSKSSFGIIDRKQAYGYTNLDSIKKNIDVFDILEDAKLRLNSMGYEIGYEFEINFTSINNSYKIICHMQHSDLIDEKPFDPVKDSDYFDGL